MLPVFVTFPFGLQQRVLLSWWLECSVRPPGQHDAACFQSLQSLHCGTLTSQAIVHERHSDVQNVEAIGQRHLSGLWGGQDARPGVWYVVALGKLPVVLISITITWWDCAPCRPLVLQTPLTVCAVLWAPPVLWVRQHTFR